MPARPANRSHAAAVPAATWRIRPAEADSTQTQATRVLRGRSCGGEPSGQRLARLGGAHRCRSAGLLVRAHADRQGAQRPACCNAGGAATQQLWHHFQQCAAVRRRQQVPAAAGGAAAAVHCRLEVHASSVAPTCLLLHSTQTFSFDTLLPVACRQAGVHGDWEVARGVLDRILCYHRGDAGSVKGVSTDSAWRGWLEGRRAAVARCSTVNMSVCSKSEERTETTVPPACCR